MQLGYLVLFLLAGFLIKNASKEDIKKEIYLKISCAFAGFIITAGVINVFYQDIKETTQILINTVYPGSRKSAGGGVTLFRYFSGFYGGMLRDGYVPQSFFNISEASNFILLYPVVIGGMMLNLAKKQKNNIIVIVMLMYIIMITWWMKFGFSSGIASMTLWSFVPTFRCYLGPWTG